MAGTAILGKLWVQFNTPIQSECQVVYILAEIRKYLELKKEEESYKSLLLYCNWALHAHMKKEMAREVVRYFEEALKFGKGDYLPERLKGFFETTTLGAFKLDFRRFATEKDLVGTLVTDNDEWDTFLDFYSRVIEDCPLLCLDASTDVLASVIVRRIDCSEVLNWKSDSMICLGAYNWLCKLRTGEEIFVSQTVLGRHKRHNET